MANNFSQTFGNVIRPAVVALVLFGYGGASAMAEQFSELQRKAIAGEIPAQRQLAECYLNGCSGLASPNPALACAWRIVIVASGTPDVSAADVETRRLTCAALAPADQKEAAAQARSIFKRIHARELVLPADFFGGPARAK